MRELKVVELDVDGNTVLCQTDSGERFTLRIDDRFRAAARGDRAAFDRSADQTMIDVEVHNVLRPKDIQSKIRAGASVEQVANASGMPIERVERFAHPVLLERSRAAELATAAHPVLSDGPAVLTLLETVSTALVARGSTRTRRTGTPGATRTDAGRYRWRGRPAGPTTSPISGSPPERTAVRSPRSTRRLTSSSTRTSSARCARSHRSPS